MTYLSPIRSFAADQSKSKGSIYGKASRWSSDHSFQRSSRDGESYGSNGAKVLSGKVTHSIIK